MVCGKRINSASQLPTYSRHLQRWPPWQAPALMVEHTQWSGLTVKVAGPGGGWAAAGAWFSGFDARLLANTMTPALSQSSVRDCKISPAAASNGSDRLNGSCWPLAAPAAPPSFPESSRGTCDLRVRARVWPAERVKRVWTSAVPWVAMVQKPSHLGSNARCARAQMRPSDSSTLHFGAIPSVEHPSESKTRL